ncbi:MAG TPA: relaxase domain-containing protein [Opitutaceae bacterium]|jgi:hypothetical protein
MEHSPFPLPVGSSHHSHYHRFLLGADAATLAPFPKPFCVGRLAAALPDLAARLDLPRWRKLYHAAFPWAEGFGPADYAVGNVPPFRPLPEGFARPARRHAAFDFVQMADPSVTALALVAGDRRILARFVAMNEAFCAALEPGVGARQAGPDGSRSTGRMLAGIFAEPNNRWLMPFLHVHVRVLNFTSFPGRPARLECVDQASLTRAGTRARAGWVTRQASMLSELGYRVFPRVDPEGPLRVEGVGPKVLASIEAPRIAVLRVLERTLLGGGGVPQEASLPEMPAPVVAAMAEQLEVLLARSVAHYRPPKIGIPSEGPWRAAVRSHLGRCCPGALDSLDREARRARAEPMGTSLFATPSLDAAHRHASSAEPGEAPVQNPTDPELGALPQLAGSRGAAPRLLLAEFCAALNDVNEAIVRAPGADNLAALRAPLAAIDRHGEAPGAAELRRAAAILGAGLEREAGREEAESAAQMRHRWVDRVPLAALDRLFEDAGRAMACEEEIGGRCP